MSSAKDSMIDIIGRQPDDSTYDEILREMAYARMVQPGLEDADAGRTVSNSEVQRKSVLRCRFDSGSMRALYRRF